SISIGNTLSTCQLVNWEVSSEIEILEEKIMAAFMDLLRTSYSNLTSSERRVADYIVANPSDATRFTLSDLASLSEVGVGTIGRFCSKLGYNGFPELKVALAAELLTHERTERALPELQNPLHALAQGLVQAGINNITDTYNFLDWNTLQRTCDILAQAK